MDNAIEAQKVIDCLLDQIRQLSLSNAMLMAKIDQVFEGQNREIVLEEQ